MKKKLFELIEYIKVFGISTAYKCRIAPYIFNSNKSYQRKHKAILNYLRKYDYIIDEADNSASMITIADDSPIWIFWYQGEDSMPPIIKSCYKSVLKNAVRHPVNLVTKWNISEYLDVPLSILHKLESNTLKIQTFSDWLRFALLQKYGGWWLDASIYVSATFPSVNKSFFSIKQQKCSDYFVSEYKWTGFLMGSSVNNKMVNSVKEVLQEYIIRENLLIDYYAIDYCIRSIYNKDEYSKRTIDDVAMSNPELYTLKNVLLTPYSNEEYQRITKDTCFHKLNWRVMPPRERDSYLFFDWLIDQSK